MFLYYVIFVVMHAITFVPGGCILLAVVPTLLTANGANMTNQMVDNGLPETIVNQCNQKATYSVVPLYTLKTSSISFRRVFIYIFTSQR